MTENAKYSERFWRRDNPIAYGAAISAAILLGYLVIGLREHCVGTVCKTNFEVFWESDPNEIGDTFAGFFSALAFVWIITTVFLQSYELREQRKELRLTRQQLERTGIAAEAQSKALEATESSLLFDQLLNQLRIHLLEFNIETEYGYSWKLKDSNRRFDNDYDSVKRYYDDYEDSVQLVPDFEQELTPNEIGNNDFVRTALNEISLNIDSIAWHVSEGNISEFPSASHARNSIHFLLNRLTATMELLSPPHFERARSLKVRRFKIKYEKFINDPNNWHASQSSPAQ